MDGSARITFEELQQEWAGWDEEFRIQFCSECSWIKGQADFPDILRFLMGVGKASEIGAIALSIASVLPQDEAFRLLETALRNAPSAKSANISQGLAKTKHKEAEPTLRQHLARLWSLDNLWLDDEFMNWTAYSTVCCIEHLLGLGAPAMDFEMMVRRLANHPCKGLQDSSRRFLKEHYSWLEA
jgi:hypothetical protein